MTVMLDPETGELVRISEPNGSRWPINRIRIGDRYRKDMGDLKALARSIRKHGLMHPVVVLADGTLVAGHRRLEAVKSLGLREVPVTIVDIEDLLEAEQDENTVRKDFTPSEAVAIGRAIEERHRQKIAAVRSEVSRRSVKIRDGAISLVTEQGDLGGATGLAVGATRDVAAAAVGMAPSTYARAKEVVKAAEDDPETFGDLVEQMDDTGKVQPAVDEMRRRRAERGEEPKRKPGPKPNQATVKRRHDQFRQAMASIVGTCSAAGDLPFPDGLESEEASRWAADLLAAMKHTRRLAARLQEVAGNGEH